MMENTKSDTMSTAADLSAANDIVAPSNLPELFAAYTALNRQLITSWTRIVPLDPAAATGPWLRPLLNFSSEVVQEAMHGRTRLSCEVYRAAAAGILEPTVIEDQIERTERFTGEVAAAWQRMTDLALDGFGGALAEEEEPELIGRTAFDVWLDFLKGATALQRSSVDVRANSGTAPSVHYVGDPQAARAAA